MENRMMEQAPLSAQEISGELMEDSMAREAQEAQELEAAKASVCCLRMAGRAKS